MSKIYGVPVGTTMKVEAIQNRLDVADVDEAFIIKVLEEYLATHQIECGIEPIPKTDEMTQPIGVDENGMLWVAPIGSREPGKYTVMSVLKKVESTNPVAIIEDGEPYTATLKATDGYQLGKVIVTMGSIDVTSEVYANGAINIPAVTGDIIITASAAAAPTDIMSHFKYLGPTTYSPGTYTAWCPTGLIYDETRDHYVQMMNVQNRHGATPNACELWCNTIDPYTLEHTKPVFVARTGEMQSGSMTSYGALGCCVKNGVYYMFSKNERGYYKSVDGGITWKHEAYETGPDANAWGCYVLSNGRMIMGSDTNNHKVYYSDDDGKNWTTVQSENFNEPTFIDFGNGTLMAICRENKDSANNLKHPWMHVSYDNGETWTASVEMTSVGYMGNNNCNAYVHDSYVELFVGCRNWENSPQWDEKYYKINQYVLDLNKGPVDEFEFVNEVYAFKDGENPQNNLMKYQLTADDFSTPVIAIKDKSHALLTFYGPVAYGVTHHMIAVGNLPVDDFEIPSIIPDSYKASQTFSGEANDGTITVCGSYGITPYGNYPSFSGGYLNFSDIEDGGFVHVKVMSRGYADANGTTWINSAFSSVADGIVKSASRTGGLGYSPMPTNPTKVLSGGAFGKRTAIPSGGELDRYAFIDRDCWWIYNDGTWFYIRNGDIPIEGLTYSNISSTPELEAYNKEGLTSYKILVAANANLGTLKQIEYDKKLS